MTRQGARLARVGVALASTFLVLLIAEVGLRLVTPPQLAIDYQPAIYAADSALGFRYIPGRDSRLERLEFNVPIHINDAGFFDDDFTIARDPVVTRVAVLGDSFTAGFHVGRTRNFPDRLEAQLNAGSGDRRWEVMNFGMIGTGTVQQSVLFHQEVRAYEPDVVMLVFYENDIPDVQHGLIYRETYRDHALIYDDPAQREPLMEKVDAFLDTTPQLLRIGVARSYLVRLAYAAWMSVRATHRDLTLLSNRARADNLRAHQAPRAEAVAAIVELICEIDAACRARACDFVLVVIPSKEEVKGSRELAAAPILDRVELRGIRTLSLLDAFRRRHRRGERLYWRYDGHCNENGYALIASELHRHLLD